MKSVAPSLLSLGLLSCSICLTAADKSLSLLDAEAHGIGVLNVRPAASWFLDLRLSAGQEPFFKQYAYDRTDSSGLTNKTTLTSDPGKSLEIYHLELVAQAYPRGGRIGMVMGIGCFAGTIRAGGQADTYHGYVGGAEAKLGVALRLTPKVHLELAPFVGVGRNMYSVEGGNFDGSDARGYGRFLTYGVGASGFYTAESGLQIGATAGYVTNDSHATIDYNSDILGTPGTTGKARLSGTVSGAYGTLSIGVRF
ncbi:MAG: hypothetical protein AAB263_07425 [Planctomycetota bacterium]